MTTPAMADSYYNPANDFSKQHEGSESLAINNRFINCFLARLSLHTTAKLFNGVGPCKPISKRMILKTGFSVHLTEAATMKYITEHTSVPVPKVYCSFLHKNRAYIIMERIPGVDRASAWRNLSKQSLEKIFSQLKDIIHELRSLEAPPGNGIESCVGGSLYDSRLPHGTPRFGPFKTTQAFHRWLRDNTKVTQIGSHVSEGDAEDLKAMIEKHDGPWPAPIFTHCDLNPSNILVSGDKIVGIDWEFSGWYPAYWEFTSAWLGNILRKEWQEILISLLDPYREELDMEKTRHKWWGEW